MWFIEYWRDVRFFSRAPLLALLLLVPSVVLTAETVDSVRIKDTWRSVTVISVVPYPPDVTREDLARSLAAEAAVTQGKNALLTHILSKKAHSGRLLSVAEIPSTELQQQIREMVAGAAIQRTHYQDKRCTVTLELKKNNLKKILKSN